MRLEITGAELLPKDVIFHDDRIVYTVLERPIADPGTWQLGCLCRDAAGKAVRISIPPTAPVTVDRKETA